MAREPDMIVRLVGDGEQPDQVVQVVGDQVITATPGDVSKVVTVAADGTLTLAAAAGGASDHGDLTGLSDDDHPYLLESAVSAFGLTVLDDANAAAVRATIDAAQNGNYVQGEPAAFTFYQQDADPGGANGDLWLDTDATAVDLTGHLSASNNLSDLTNAATARTNLALVVGTNVQAFDAELAALAGLTSAADKLPYFTGSGTAALADLSAAARTVLDDATVAAMLATLLGAPLASPALTGNPTAPTPSAADNDTSIATTAYVQTELGSFVRTAQALNAQTGTTYTLVAADAGKLVTLSNGSAVTLTVPQDSDATIAIGTYVDLYALGAGQVTVAAGTGATLRVSGLTAKSRAQYARFGVQKVSANTWVVFGDLAAS